MRNYYYQNRPYTEPAAPPPSAGPFPLLPEQAPAVPPCPETPRRSKKRGWVALCVFLLLMAGTITALAALGWGDLPVNQVLDVLPSSPSITTGPGSGFSIPLPSAGEDPTTIERGEIGTGVTLTISPLGGEVLSLQALYQKSLPSIVGIRAD